MKIVMRIALSILFLGALSLLAFLLLWHRDKDAWPTIAATLAVIAAIIAVFPALRVLELQEDALCPRPTVFFDLTSRHNLLQLRVKNLGGRQAYGIRLIWNSHPLDSKGEKIASLDQISVLLPGESVSTLVGPSTEMVKKYSSAQFTGNIQFTDATGKKISDRFVCSVDAAQKRLVHDEELPKTLRDLQDLPKELARIADVLENLIGSDRGNRSRE